MIAIRPSAARGRADFGWLDSRHTFSFGQYYDPAHMGFGPLRVINEDKVAAGAGFDTHGHRDMEIISLVIDGALQHRDSMGESAIIERGDVQIMGAGTGVEHSEFNASQTDPVHFLQIWLLPKTNGMAPRYQQVAVPDAARNGRLRLLGSLDGRDGSVQIRSDAELYGARLATGETVSHRGQAGRQFWLQVVSGRVTVDGDPVLASGDGAAITDQREVQIAANEDAEFILFDLGA